MSNINIMKPLPGINKNKSIVKDHDLRTEAGVIYTVTQQMLGRGSYGDVYAGFDEMGNKVAVKSCEINKDGIPNILETSIMNTYIHPNINRCIRTYSTDKKLYMIQELAKCDISYHTRRDKNNYRPNVDELKRWCFSIAEAVHVLHSDNIIHADIKANNILLFEDGKIKLTDFTLACKKWFPYESFNNSACTCTHRPLECFLRQDWNESLDIWSLGCTFYEIAYGELLFPFQGELEPKVEILDDDTKLQVKNRLKMRSINAILDWGNRGPNKYTASIEEYPINFIKFRFCKEYNNPQMATFNNLLNGMLQIDKNNRLTIEQVLDHPFFTGYEREMYFIITRPIRQILPSEQARINRFINMYVDINNVFNSGIKFATDNNIKLLGELSYKIYTKCIDLNDLSENIKTATCVWIASKLIYGRPININDISPHYILSCERDICHNLSFMLHN